MTPNSNQMKTKNPQMFQVSRIKKKNPSFFLKLINYNINKERKKRRKKYVYVKSYRMLQLAAYCICMKGQMNENLMMRLVMIS